ncbi:DinB family protein [Paraliobacillus sediminis]|uniref:DinB family protein n=1 Tax=Paraliobacillus sediminis TaxID=1885916 RepID=UPI000E3CDAE6|nr:DinB family protein [Paraliobacillus sediminis]
MTKAIFLSQLKAIHKQNTWFVSLKSALNGLNERDTKERQFINSIEGIVQHLIFYNELELKKFKGETIEQRIHNNHTTFRNHEHKSWVTTTVTLDAILQDWEETITNAAQEKITVWEETLSYLFLHNAYHIGQIVYIRKQAGDWNDKSGVDYNF